MSDEYVRKPEPPRDTCECRSPLRIRRYLGQWACAFCNLLIPIGSSR